MECVQFTLTLKDEERFVEIVRQISSNNVEIVDVCINEDSAIIVTEVPKSSASAWEAEIEKLGHVEQIS